MILSLYYGDTILSGNLTLQSSHSRAFQQYVLTPTGLLSLKLLFELSHSRRHSIWINLIVPLHLQGEISEFSGVSSSQRQILHIGIESSSTWLGFLLISPFFLPPLFFGEGDRKSFISPAAPFLSFFFLALVGWTWIGITECSFSGKLVGLPLAAGNSNPWSRRNEASLKASLSLGIYAFGLLEFSLATTLVPVW